MEMWRCQTLCKEETSVGESGAGESSSNTTRRQAFREAKEAAGIPKSAEYKTHKFVFEAQRWDTSAFYIHGFLK